MNSPSASPGPMLDFPVQRPHPRCRAGSDQPPSVPVLTTCLGDRLRCMVRPHGPPVPHIFTLVLGRSQCFIYRQHFFQPIRAQTGRTRVTAARKNSRASHHAPERADSLLGLLSLHRPKEDETIPRYRPSPACQRSRPLPVNSAAEWPFFVRISRIGLLTLVSGSSSIGSIETDSLVKRAMVTA
jgi:hypothetical protein